MITHSLDRAGPVDRENSVKTMRHMVQEPKSLCSPRVLKYGRPSSVPEPKRLLRHSPKIHTSDNSVVDVEDVIMS